MKQLLTEIFQAYHTDIYAYLYSLSHDASLSEDLTSEVFVDVVRSIASFRGESDIKTWLFTIARRKWIDHLRRQNRQPQTQSIHELYDSLHLSVPDRPDDKSITQCVRQVLAQESALNQSVFQMHLEGYSYFEIASKHGISENSARVIYFRIKAKIKKNLEKEGFRYD